MRLAGLGWVEFAQQKDGGHVLRLKTPAKSREDSLAPAERALLSSLRTWSRNPENAPSWSLWKESLRQQCQAEGALTEPEWRRLDRCSVFPPLGRLALPSQKAQAARALAQRLDGYPVYTDPLPQTRQDWDAALGYAVALGRTKPFLKRTREVCEYYARHFQGIVMTFYTPSWYAPFPASEADRFAFLTGGMTELFHGFRWSRLSPGDRP